MNQFIRIHVSLSTKKLILLRESIPGNRIAVVRIMGSGDIINLKILTLPLNSVRTLGELFKFSVPQFANL